MPIRTLGEAFDAKWRVRTRCLGLIYAGNSLMGNCGQKYQLDMETLVWTRGRELPLARLPERLKCPRCGGRRIRLLYDIPAEPMPGEEAAQVWSTKEIE
jgi:hypothetical protein